MDLLYVSDRFTFGDIFTLILMLFLTSKLLKTSLSCSGTLWSTRRVKHLWVISPNELWGLVSIYLKSIFPQISRHEIQNSSRGVKTAFKFGKYSVSRSPSRKLKPRFAHINFYFNLMRIKFYAGCKLTRSPKNVCLKCSLKDHNTRASDCQ